MQNAARSYFQTQVTTTTAGDVLIMLYDGAIKFLRQAQEKIAARDYAQKGILISKALDILNELQGSLNAAKGGELAVNLQKLYFFCSSRLLAANLKMDVAMVEEVIRILSGLRDAYGQINAQYGGSVAPVAQTSSNRSAPLSPRPMATAQTPTVTSVGLSPLLSAPLANPTPVSIVTANSPSPAPTVIPTASPRPPLAPPLVQASSTTQAPRPKSPPPAGTVITPVANPVRRAAAAYAAGRATG